MSAKHPPTQHPPTQAVPNKTAHAADPHGLAYTPLEPKPLLSRENPHVRRWARLASPAHKGRLVEGQTLLDGPHVVEAALATSQPLCELMVSESGLQVPEIRRLLATAPLHVARFRLPDRLFAQISPTQTPSGLMASLPLPSALNPALASRERSWVWLDRVQDAGNLGGLLRTTAAAGLREVFLSHGCARAFSPRSLRAGMGAQFVLNIYEELDLRAFYATLAQDDRPFPLRAMALSKTAHSLYTQDLSEPCIWLFGSEGQGLDPALLALAPHPVIIPIAEGIDSLNVAAAAAICLFEQKRQTRAGASSPDLC